MGTNLGTNEKDRIGLLPQRIGYRRHLDRITAIKRIGLLPSKEVSLCQKNRQESVLPTTSFFFGLPVQVCPFILSQKNKKFTVKFNKFIINYTILVLAIFSSS